MMLCRAVAGGGGGGGGFRGFSWKIHDYCYVLEKLRVENVRTVGVKLKFPFRFRSTKPKQYTVLTKNSYKTDKNL